MNSFPDISLRFVQAPLPLRFLKGTEHASDYVERIRGTVLIHAGANAPASIGRFQFAYVNLDAANVLGIKMHAVLTSDPVVAEFARCFNDGKPGNFCSQFGLDPDEMTADLEGGKKEIEALEAFDGYDHFRGSYVALFPHAAKQSNIIAIERLELLPAYRGRGLGKFVLLALLHHRYCTARAIVLDATPLGVADSGGRPGGAHNWHQRLDLGKFDQDVARATARLVRYFAQSGFVQVPGHPSHMLMHALEEELALPWP